jgi:hypothetical protein
MFCMEIPIINQDLAERIEQAETEAQLSRMRGVQNIPGNPLAVEIERFGGALAFAVRGAPHLELYRVLCLGSQDMDHIGSILDWFRQRGLKPQIDISPYTSSIDLLSQLARQGLFQSRFLTVLYGVPSAEPPVSAVGVTIREYPPDRLDEFARVSAQIDGVPEDDLPLWADIIQHQFRGWRCYLAFVGGRPASHGVLRIHSHSAVAMYAATLPEFRNFGCQTALLRQRIYDAALSECDLMSCSSYPTTISQRNQERAGFRVAYTKAIWTPVNF